jgi:hypothetical protein
MADQESATEPSLADAPEEQLAQESTSDNNPITQSRHRKQQSYSREAVLRRFNGCSRCSLFLTGYRLNHEPEFEQAISQIEGDWLALPWSAEMRELVNKSYGSRTDIKRYYLEGICPECKRPYAYAEPHPEQPAWFLVKL